MSSSSSSSTTATHYVALAGSISGVMEGVTVQPLELLKTRFQLNEGKPMRVLPAVREIVAEGGVRQLYRGGLPEITGLIPRATAALSTLEFSRRLFRSWHDGELLTRYAYLSGAMSGVTEGIAFGPFQVLKVRLMAKEHLGRYKNTFHCLSEVLRTEGPSALFIGMVPTLLRNCIWNGLYYGSMHEIEVRLPHMDSDVGSAVRQLLIGTGLGVVCTCFNTPFDVVKSRFQSQLPQQRRYTSVLPTLATIWREEGPRALYRGFVPKALRLGIGQSVGLLTFQRLLRAFGVDAPREVDEPEYIPVPWE